MKNYEIVLQVLAVSEAAAEGTGIDIYDVEYVKEGPNWYVRIYIDKPDGVNLDDCEFISRKVEKELDEKDFIQTAYMLEVSSPGIDRKPRRENIEKKEMKKSKEGN